MTGRMAQFHEVEDLFGESPEDLPDDSALFDSAAEHELGDEAGIQFENDRIDHDLDVGFAADADLLRQRRSHRDWSCTLISTAASVAVHGLMVLVAVTVVRSLVTRTTTSHTPPSALFAYGDTSPEHGLKIREGREDMPGGFAGAPNGQPPGEATPALPPAPAEPSAEEVPAPAEATAPPLPP